MWHLSLFAKLWSGFIIIRNGGETSLEKRLLYYMWHCFCFVVLDHARDEHMALVDHFGQAWNLLREAIAKVGQYRYGYYFEL